MSSPAKQDTRRTVQQIEKDTADRIEAAMLYSRIRQAAEWRDALRTGALLPLPEVFSQN